MNNSNHLYRLYSDGSLTVVNSGVRARKPINRKNIVKGSIEAAGIIQTNYKSLGSIKKTFVMSPAVGRVIRSSAIKQFLTKKHSIHFLTLTFPEKVDEKKANKYLSKYLDNLYKNYKLKSHVITKELHKSGNPHYHCLFDLPWTDYYNLNVAWNAVFKNDFKYSPNALTRGKFPIVKNIGGVAKYISKYISKAYSEIFMTRIYFTSRNVLDRGTLIDFNTFLYLTSKFKHKVKFDEYYTIYRLEKFAALAKWFILPKNKPKIHKKPKIIPDVMPLNINFYN